MITIAAIQSAVASECKVPLSVMREPSCSHNPSEHSRPRQVAMTLSARLTDHSLQRIGHYFGGRDHSTVWHAMRVVERRNDPVAHEAMRRVTLALVRR